MTAFALLCTVCLAVGLAGAQSRVRPTAATKVDSMMFEKFVVASQRLLVTARVLAVPDFVDVFRRRQRATHLDTSITVLERAVNVTVALVDHRANETYDWVVLASPAQLGIAAAQVTALLRACVRLTHFGVLLRTLVVADPVHIFRETDYTYDEDYSNIIGHSARVYYLKQLIAHQPQAALQFQTTIGDVEWTDTVALGRARFRASTPLSLQTRLATAGNVVIGINSNAAYADKRAAIRQTWAEANRMQELDIVVFFTVAATPDTVAENREFGDLLLLEASERYNESLGSVLPLKGIAGRQVGMAYATNAQWFYRVDDDTLLVVDAFLAMLGDTGQPERAHLIGCAIDAPPFRNSTSYSARWNMPPSVFKPHRYPRFMGGGPGYVLSRKACECAIAGERRPNWRFLRIEDVLMRLTLLSWCEESLVLTSMCDRFLLNFIKNPKANLIAMHYATPEFMHQFHAKHFA
jgi:hypothetical protein